MAWRGIFLIRGAQGRHRLSTCTPIVHIRPSNEINDDDTTPDPAGDSKPTRRRSRGRTRCAETRPGVKHARCRGGGGG